MSGVTVELEADAVPIVRVMGALARRSLQDQALALKVAKLEGVVAVKSANDPQAVSFRFERGSLRLSRGVAADVDVTITADLDDDDAKPKVTGAVRRPQLAMTVGKLLEPTLGSWEEEADAFLTAALADPACPRPIRLVCTDDGHGRQWGGDGEPTIEVHGAADELASCMAGQAVLGDRLLAGHVAMVGDLRELSVLTRFCIDHLFGELT
ncbi:MAG: hypothetical protein AAF480_03085 [Actinomycetota bacterium]